MRKFPTGATRDNNDDKLDYQGFTSPHVKRAYAEYMHMHRDTANGKRESDNWKKGIPLDVYVEAFFRHVEELQYIYETSNDYNQVKDKLCAVKFNTNGWLHTLLTTPTLDDSWASINWNYGGSNEYHWPISTNGWSNHTRTDNHPEE